MTSWCTGYGDCGVSATLSTVQIIAIVVGSLVGVAGLIVTIILIVWLVKRSKRRAAVIVQPGVFQTNAGFAQTMHTTYQGPYGQQMQMGMPPPMQRPDNNFTPPQKV